MRIKKLYVDNFRCLQNFELNPEPVTLLMGDNGSGKSTVVDVLNRLKSWCSGDPLRELFPAHDKTQWDQRPFQLFEIELADLTDNTEDIYTYHLSLHQYDKHLCLLMSERLRFNDTTLYEYINQRGRLYPTPGTEGVELLVNRDSSGIWQLRELSGYAVIDRFREAMRNLIVGRIEPQRMGYISHQQAAFPNLSLSNYASWLGSLSGEYQAEYFRLFEHLKESIDGFRSFSFKPVREGEKDCFVQFQNGTNSDSLEVRLDRISDGQKVLLCLYTILEYANLYPIVILDEPQNFVGLREIQPWLMQAMDRFEEVGGQLIISSHSPEITNLLAPAHGLWLERSPTGPTRVKKYEHDPAGVSPSEIVARG